MFACLYMYVYACVEVREQLSRVDSLLCGSKDQAWVPRLGGKHLYILSHFPPPPQMDFLSVHKSRLYITKLLTRRKWGSFLSSPNQHFVWTEDRDNVMVMAWGLGLSSCAIKIRSEKYTGTSREEDRVNFLMTLAIKSKVLHVSKETLKPSDPCCPYDYPYPWPIIIKERNHHYLFWNGKTWAVGPEMWLFWCVLGSDMHLCEHIEFIIIDRKQAASSLYVPSHRQNVNLHASEKDVMAREWHKDYPKLWRDVEENYLFRASEVAQQISVALTWLFQPL